MNPSLGKELTGTWDTTSYLGSVPSYWDAKYYIKDKYCYIEIIATLGHPSSNAYAFVLDDALNIKPIRNNGNIGNYSFAWSNERGTSYIDIRPGSYSEKAVIIASTSQGCNKGHFFGCFPIE